MPDDGKLDTESDSGEFWVLMGGFAPISKKIANEDDVIPESTPATLYRYSDILLFFPHLISCMQVPLQVFACHC